MATIDAGGSDSERNDGRTLSELIAPDVDKRWQLSVLGGFALEAEGDIRPGISIGPQRLLACLAVHGTVSPTRVGRLLWPEESDESGAALSGLDDRVRQMVTTTDTGLGLSEDLDVDLHRSQVLARSLIAADSPLSETEIGHRAVSALSSELLPGWYDDWAVIAAENWHHLRLRALEAAAERLTAAGRYAEAATAARAAIRAEPLKESARAGLIRVHLATGGRADASEELARYRDLLNGELGIEPTRRLTHLLE